MNCDATEMLKQVSTATSCPLQQVRQGRKSLKLLLFIDGSRLGHHLGGRPCCLSGDWAKRVPHDVLKHDMLPTEGEAIGNQALSHIGSAGSDSGLGGIVASAFGQGFLAGTLCLFMSRGQLCIGCLAI